tara:strand:+ start:301 stop:474 length:174 start_codon:yes stop_codon:yes gene_type:complete
LIELGFYTEIADLLRKHGGKTGAELIATALDHAGGETAALLRKHGGKTGEELKAEGE